MTEKRSGKKRRHDKGRRSLERGTLEGLRDLIEKIRSGEDTRSKESRRTREERRAQDGDS